MKEHSSQTIGAWRVGRGSASGPSLVGDGVGRARATTPGPPRLAATGGTQRLGLSGRA